VGNEREKSPVPVLALVYHLLRPRRDGRPPEPVEIIGKLARPLFLRRDRSTAPPPPALAQQKQFEAVFGAERTIDLRTLLIAVAATGDS
jgi:hypothetical protein